MNVRFTGSLVQLSFCLLRHYLPPLFVRLRTLPFLVRSVTLNYSVVPIIFWFVQGHCIIFLLAQGHYCFLSPKDTHFLDRPRTLRCFLFRPRTLNYSVVR